MQKCTLALGCFWKPEENFKSKPGILKTEVGYAGGSSTKTTYEEVCTGNTGHAEVVRLTFDENKISFKKILDFDSKNGFLICESGITINELLNYLTPKGWFLPVVPGTSFVTIGGAIANDIHGKNHHKVGSFGNFVISFELLRSDGEIIKCSDKENNNFFG